MKPTPPVTQMHTMFSASEQRGLRRALRWCGRGAHADSFVAEPGPHDVPWSPDIARIDDRGRRTVVGRAQAPAHLSEVWRTIAAPLGQQHKGVCTVQRIVVAVDHLDAGAM